MRNVEHLDASHRITLDSLLRTADTLSYATSLPYLALGNFTEHSALVIKDSLFMQGRADSLYYAKAYRFELEAGDTIWCHFEGNFYTTMMAYQQDTLADFVPANFNNFDYGGSLSNFYQRYYLAPLTDGDYYLVTTSWQGMQQGAWNLKLTKNQADLQLEIDTVYVELVASDHALNFAYGTTESDIRTALAKVKLYAVNGTDTITSVVNNSYLWSIDMTTHVATYEASDSDLPANYAFGSGENSVEVVLNIATRLTNPELNSSLVLYPNPARDLCYLQVENIDAEMIYLFDISGRLLIAQRNNGAATQSITISGLAAGIYHIRLGNQVAKLVVKP